MSLSTTNSRILIFTKAPHPGYVKTRLAPALDPQQAAELQTYLIYNTLAMATELTDGSIDLWCTPDTSHPVFNQCREKYGITLHTQRGDNLGDRMFHAARSALQGASNVVLIGTDCPELTSTYLSTAFNSLEQGRDAVIGPADDGGYVLLGLRYANPHVFRNIPWGTDRVLKLTRERLKAFGYQWDELPTLRDIDRPEDLVYFPELPVKVKKRADLKLEESL